MCRHSTPYFDPSKHVRFIDRVLGSRFYKARPCAGILRCDPEAAVQGWRLGTPSVRSEMSNANSAPHELDAIIVGPGSAVSTRSIVCASSPHWCTRSRRPAGFGTGTGTAPRGCRSMSKAWKYSYSSSDELQQNGIGRTLRRPEILRYINHGRPLRPQAQHRFNTRVKECDLRQQDKHLDGDDDTVVPQPLALHHGPALSTPRTQNYPGLESFKGNGIIPACGRMKVSISRIAVGSSAPAVRRPVDTDYRQTGEAPLCLPGNANFSLPARNAPLDLTRSAPTRRISERPPRPRSRPPFGIAAIQRR